jgi:hypothetical protein
VDRVNLDVPRYTIFAFLLVTLALANLRFKKRLD